MLIDINKIIIKDRIRKDFGDIQKLADNITEIGLINPPVINKNYELLAGERRLRACKLLGWPQIEVKMMDTRDAEHELDIEVNENSERKDFTMTEWLDIARRKERIEAAKAKERMGESGGNISTPLGKTRDIVAEATGIGSGRQYEKMKVIEDNRDLLSPEDFADWDEGRLSTNKAFQMVKARQKELEAENQKLRQLVSEKDVQNIALKRQLDDAPVREVEVAPSDYEMVKKENRSLRRQYDEMSEKWKKSEAMLDQMRRPENERAENIKKSALFFCAGVSNFIESYGGYIWLTEEINHMEQSEREGYIRAVNALDAWVNQMKENLNV